MLQITQVSKTYRKQGKQIQAAKSLSLELNSGSLAVVQGPSGCGKSTLLLMAGGLLRPDSGQVLIDGTDIYTLSSSQRAYMRAATIGFVFQQFHLINYFTVLQNVMAPALAMPDEDARSRAEQLIERFGLEQRRHHKPAELSTGERQRTALARAMMNNPSLILADEPTGNLDPANTEVVMDELEQFAARGGAVLMVSHDENAAGESHQCWKMRSGVFEENALTA